MKHILVVDDEKNIRDIIGAYLEREGYKVYLASDGEMAMNIFATETIDMIILDLMMPKLTGEQVCEKIRKQSRVPIIMLTAKVEDEDVIKGIKNGADDYIRKPFSVRELMIRIHALFRRMDDSIPPMDVFKFNEEALIVDFSRMKLIKYGEEISLTPNEFKILRILVANAGIILSREQIIAKIFGAQFDGFDRTIDTHIKNIRQKIEHDPKKPQYIRTVYGMGYRFSDEVE